MTVFLLLSDDRIHTAFKSCIYLWLEGLNLVKFGSCIISLRLSPSPLPRSIRGFAIVFERSKKPESKYWLRRFVIVLHFKWG